MKEPKTIFGKIIAAILSVFISKWPTFVANLWKRVPDELQDKIMLGVRIVERLKTWEGGSFAEFVKHVLDGEVLEDAAELIKEALKNKFGSDNGHDYVGSFYNPDDKLWHTVASDLNREFTGLPYGQSALTTEVAYQAYKRQKAV